MSKQKNKTKKEEFPQWCYDGLMDFALRMEHDLEALDTIRVHLKVLIGQWALGRVSDKELLHSTENRVVPKLVELRDRLLKSAKELPYANEVYYARQYDRTEAKELGDDYVWPPGKDERPPLLTPGWAQELGGEN